MQRRGYWQADNMLSHERARPIHTRHAGFKSFVADSFTHRAANLIHPDDFRNDEEYERVKREETPDHVDDHLGHFATDHGSRADWVKGGGGLRHVDLGQGVHSTQTHVAQYHIDRFLQAPKDTAWYLKHGGEDDGYLGNHHPMFVTHQGRLHAVEGHHRIAAAIQRGDNHIQGWHFDLDKHPINYMSDLHRDPKGGQLWLPTDEKCPDCEGLHADGRELSHAH